VDLGVVFAAETGFKLATDPDTVRARTSRSSLRPASRNSASLKDSGQVRLISQSK
jgi:hypothetical protein